ncbi:chloroplastic import inner membrane translocase subunit HP30-2-like protein [Tanacetum coccineum]
MAMNLTKISFNPKPFNVKGLGTKSFPKCVPLMVCSNNKMDNNPLGPGLLISIRSKCSCCKPNTPAHESDDDVKFYYVPLPVPPSTSDKALIQDKKDSELVKPLISSEFAHVVTKVTFMVGVMLCLSVFGRGVKFGPFKLTMPALLRGGTPLVQARNVAVMSGVYKCIHSVMTRSRGKEDVQTSLAAGFGAVFMGALMYGAKGRSAIAHGVCVALFMAGVNKIMENNSHQQADDVLGVNTSGKLSNRGEDRIKGTRKTFEELMLRVERINSVMTNRVYSYGNLQVMVLYLEHLFMQLFLLMDFILSITHGNGCPSSELGCGECNSEGMLKLLAGHDIPLSEAFSRKPAPIMFVRCSGLKPVSDLRPEHLTHIIGACSDLRLVARERECHVRREV